MGRTFEEHLLPTIGPKRILSLSGGGVRGLITLGVLARLETMLRDATGDPSLVLADHYDLIAGTSTGSIISVGLALGWDVAQIKALYDQLCPILFRPNRRLGVFVPKFDSRKLLETLEENLVDAEGNDLELGSDALKTGLLICTKRMDTDSAWLVSNHPGSKFYDATSNQTYLPNRFYKLKDLVRASTAAPTFLSPMRILISDGRHGFDKEEGVFVDGAIGGHNCPALVALKIATLPSYGFDWRTGAENLSMLSLGTGYFRRRTDVDEFLNRRTVEQGIAALASMISESERNTIITMQALSQPRKPRVINSEIGGLDGELVTDQPLLSFQHHDINLDNSDVRDRLNMHHEKGAKIDKLISGLRDMTNGRPRNLDLCYKLGMSLGLDLTERDLFLA